MSQPTAAEIATLRKRPNEARLYLSIFEPTTVFAAQVTGTFAHPNMQIGYYNETGDINEVLPGMTLYVGSEAGGWDVGRIRVRDIDASEVDVAENSDIPWEVGQHITVARYWEPWPVYPRYVLDSENLTVEVFKDWDISYTDENEVLGTFPNMGPHRAAFRDPGSGEASVYWAATGTANVLGQALTYFWEFEGGSPPTGTGIDPGYITYTGTGHYVTSLQVEAANGVLQNSYRHVSIYDRFEEGPAIPKAQWGITDLKGDKSQGGYTGKIWMREPVDSVRDGSLVVIFGDVRYGDEYAEIGGNAQNNAQVIFAGYVKEGSIQYNYLDSVVEFDVVSVTQYLKNIEAFSVSVESSSDPVADSENPEKGGDPWFYLLDMNVRRAIFHYLRWHSTVLLCTDVFVDVPDYEMQYFDADRESLYDAFNSLLESAVVGKAVADRQGKIWCEVDAPAVVDATGSISGVMSLDRQDWMNEPNIEEQLSGETSYLEFGGVAWDGPGEDPEPLIAAAPGDAPAPRGELQRAQGLVLDSQSQLNQLVGNAWAWKVARYPNVEIALAGTYPVFDIAPLEVVRLNLEASETQRRVRWDQKPFSIRSVQWQFDPQRKLFLPTLTLHEVTAGREGVTVDIPDEPDDSGFEQPPIDVPPIPPPSGDGVTSFGAGLIGMRILAMTQSVPAQGWNYFDTTDSPLTVSYVKPSASDWVHACGGDTFSGWRVPQTGVFLVAIELKPTERASVAQEGFVDRDDIGVGYDIYTTCGGSLATNGFHSPLFVYDPDNTDDLKIFSDSFVFYATAGQMVRLKYLVESAAGSEITAIELSSSITFLFSP